MKAIYIVWICALSSIILLPFIILINYPPVKIFLILVQTFLLVIELIMVKKR